jgi:hypothetical protein
MEQRRRIDRIILVTAGVLALAVPLLASSYLDRRIERDVEPALTDALGAAVDIGAVHAGLTGTLRIERVTVGSLFYADAIETSVSLPSLLRGDVRPDEVRIERPRVHARVDRHGNSNIGRLIERAARARRATKRPKADADPETGATSTAEDDDARVGATESALRRIVVTGGDLVVDLGDRGEIHMSGLELHPQRGGVRATAGPVRSQLIDGAYSVEARFDRAAADVALPTLSFDRLLAVGGEVEVATNGAPALRTTDVAISRRVVDDDAIHLNGRIVRTGRAPQFAATVDMGDDATRVVLDARHMPLAVFAPVLPDSFDLRRAEMTGEVRLVAGSVSSIRADVELDKLVVDHYRLADKPVSFAGTARIQAAVSASRVELRELVVSRDALTINANGWFARETGSLIPPHGELAISVPRTDCLSALVSLPPELRERLAGLHLDGTARASATVSFDRADLEATDLDLDVDVSDCRVVTEATDADPTLMRGTVAHTFFDGTTRDLGPRAPRSTYARLDQLPKHVVSAFISAEDAQFYRHNGFDPTQIERSLAIDIQDGGFSRGGSTISQQFAKNAFLSPKRNIARKLQEAVLTWRVEQTMRKRQILERYLNLIELGPHVFGIVAAARYWFDKDARRLTLKESAFLAALTPAPHSLSARIRTDGGVAPDIERRVRVVLRAMRRNGAITRERYDNVKHDRLVLATVLASR